MLLHQRRTPHTAALGEEGRLFDGIDEPLQRLRAAGKELCLHEQMVEMREELDAATEPAAHTAAEGGAAVEDAARDAGSPATASEGRPAQQQAAAGGGGSGRCPVVVGSAVGSSVLSTASGHQAVRDS